MRGTEKMKPTYRVARAIADYISDNKLNLEVFFDHPPETDNRGLNINAIVGDELSQDSKMAEVDILVVNPKKEVILVIEIEDKSQLEPKKILGVAAASLLADNFAISKKGKPPSKKRIHQLFAITNNTKIIIAGHTGSKPTETKINLRELKERFERLISNQDWLKTTDIDYEFNNDIDTTIQNLLLAIPDLLN